MGKRNIAILMNNLTSGGAERVVSVLSKPLSERYNLFIFLLDVEDIQYNIAGKILNIGGTGTSYYSKVFHAAAIINKIVRQERIECMISLLDVPNLINSIIVTKSKRIICLHGFPDSDQRKTLISRMKYAMCQYTFKRADKVVCVSRALRKYCIRCFKLDKAIVETIENPYDLKNIRERMYDSIDEKIQMFIESHRTSIAVGRLVGVKGYDLLLREFAIVCKKETDAGLLILGDGPLRDRIWQQAVELGIDDKVFLAGVKENPFAYMSKTRIYVSSSLSEGFPNTLIEAMACGIPVIQTDCKGPREILTEKYKDKLICEPQYADYGILLPDFSRADKIGKTKRELVQMYADIWIALLNDENMQKKYADAGIQRVNRYSVETCVRKYCNTIDSLLA